LLAAAACAAALAQAPAGGPTDPAFEVTSVKQNKSGVLGMGGPGDRMQNGQLRLTNRPLRVLIREAFDRRRTNEIIGGPDWVDTNRWDVLGKADSGTRAVFPMLRTLLADRFKLITHHETREMPIYELVIARRDRKLGPSLRPPSDMPRLQITFGLFKGTAPIAMLTDGLLASVVQRPVVDRTGLTGRYDIELHWTMDAPTGASETNAPPAPPGDAPSIFTAVQEQLGLKLESTKGPVEVLVIDHVERPTED